MYKNILLPHDGSELSNEAADHAIALARSVKAKLTLMHVVAHRNLVLDEGVSSKLVHKLESDYETAKSEKRPVPPGYYAQLGYLYYQAGKVDQAYQSFETEKRLFPEATRYMDLLISRLTHT